MNCELWNCLPVNQKESGRRTRYPMGWAFLASLSIAGCAPLSLPDVVPATDLPQFASAQNEVQISQSFNEVDPSWVVGALVHLSSGKVLALDSYLKPGTKPSVAPLTDVVFKDFVENSVASNAAWLDFAKAQVSNNTRVEVSVTKTMKVSIENTSVDRERLVSQLKARRIARREDYGVIIGYVSYMLSASYFRDQSAEGSAAGYGAKIGGNWYSKVGSSAAAHRIVAIWAPLPFVIDRTRDTLVTDLTEAAADAIERHSLVVSQLKVMTALRIQN